MLNFFSVGGMIEQVNLIMLLNLVIPPITTILFNVKEILKWWKLKGLKKFMENGTGEPYTQGEAYDIVSYSLFNIEDQYIYIFSTLANSIFYFSLFPLGMVYAFLSMLVCYFMNKVRVGMTLVLFDQQLPQNGQIWLEDLEEFGGELQFVGGHFLGILSVDDSWG